MAQSIGDLEQDALQLSAEDRARLAVSLLWSLEDSGEDPVEVEKLWIAEAKRRTQEIEDGSSVGIPASDVLARLKSKHEEK
jgi:hypothetical protein